MRRLRVCIYGGTDLQGTPTKFISALAYRILDAMPAVIVTGGFVHSSESPTAISTDAAALEGARKYARERQVSLKDCFEAWIPEPSLDDRNLMGAVRMNEAEGITLRIMTGRTPMGRRLAMVAGVDMIITISGRFYTEVVVEQALELGVPVLPIPAAGGDSEALLHKHRNHLAASFGAGALDKCLVSISATIEKNPEKASQAVVELFRTAKIGRCLVLLPYDDVHKELYDSVLEPAVARHMVAVRLDQLPKSDAIYASFADAIRTSTAVLADITCLNENVMYEIGYAHGRGLTPLLYTQDPGRIEQLPVYFKTVNVLVASSREHLAALVDEYLRSVKDRHVSFGISHANAHEE